MIRKILTVHLGASAFFFFLQAALGWAERFGHDKFYAGKMAFPFLMLFLASGISAYAIHEEKKWAPWLAALVYLYSLQGLVRILRDPDVSRLAAEPFMATTWMLTIWYAAGLVTTIILWRKPLS